MLIPLIVSIIIGRIRIGIVTDGPKQAASHQIAQQFLGLINIFIIPFISIVPALLYLKMRQLGGEKLSDVLAQIEEVDSESRAWQKRMRTRIGLYTPTSNRTTGH
jgi:hypothetical protein